MKKVSSCDLFAKIQWKPYFDKFWNYYDFCLRSFPLRKRDSGSKAKGVYKDVLESIMML